MPKVSSLIKKVRGWLEKVLRVSKRSFAGIAILPSVVVSAEIEVDIVVSKSEAIILMVPELNSNRKLSRIGSVLFVLKTPLNFCSSFNNSELFTINFS